jgi:hypothetical protein
MMFKRKPPEPEIIPPGQDAPRIFVDKRSTERVRVYIAKPGLLGAILVVLIVGLLSAAMLVLLLGALLAVLPALILFVAGVIVVGLLRIYFQRAP